MKAFVSAAIFYIVAIGITGIVFVWGINWTASEAYSLDSARVGEDLPVEERPGWAATGFR